MQSRSILMHFFFLSFFIFVFFFISFFCRTGRQYSPDVSVVFWISPSPLFFLISSFCFCRAGRQYTPQHPDAYVRDFEV